MACYADDQWLVKKTGWMFSASWYCVFCSAPLTTSAFKLGNEIYENTVELELRGVFLNETSCLYRHIPLIVSTDVTLLSKELSVNLRKYRKLVWLFVPFVAGQGAKCSVEQTWPLPRSVWQHVTVVHVGQANTAPLCFCPSDEQVLHPQPERNNRL